MPFNGAGLFQRVYNWVQDHANGVNITASRMDTDSDGFAAGLSNCVTRDGQGRMSADFLPASDLGANLGSGSLRWGGINGKPITSILPALVTKAAGTARTSVTTPAPDPDLVLPVAATGTYLFTLALDIWGTSTSSQGIRWNMYAVGLPTFNFSFGTYASQYVGGYATAGITSITSRSPEDCCSSSRRC